MQLFNSKSVVVVSLLLIGEAFAYHAYPTTERVPPGRPLREVPRVLGEWSMVQDIPLETEVMELLKADDTLNRTYVERPGANTLSLYIAYFRSQKTGVAPHSPKVCLPGSGWVPSNSDMVDLNVAGSPIPIHANRYIVRKGNYSSLVLYWYQTPTRTIASEYMAKVYTVVDAFRYRRSDTSLVRVVAPIENGDEQAALKRATGFVQAFYVPVRAYLPR
jgi:EpsI family protein